MGRLLMVLGPDKYQEVEYGVPRALLEQSGHKVKTCSQKKFATGHLGKVLNADLLFDEVSPSDFDAVIFVGGPGCRVYFDDPVVHQLARDFYETGKITSAICAAPGILGHAGLLKGKKVTAWPSVGETLHEFGAIYTGNIVERDGLIITGNGPEAAEAFGKMIDEAVEL